MFDKAGNTIALAVSIVKVRFPIHRGDYHNGKGKESLSPNFTFKNTLLFHLNH